MSRHSEQRARYDAEPHMSPPTPAELALMVLMLHAEEVDGPMGMFNDAGSFVYNDLPAQWGYMAEDLKGRHAGDCVFMPMSCLRCQAQDYLTKTREMIAATEKYMQEAKVSG